MEVKERRGYNLWWKDRPKEDLEYVKVDKAGNRFVMKKGYAEVLNAKGQRVTPKDTEKFLKAHKIPYKIKGDKILAARPKSMFD